MGGRGSRTKGHTFERWVARDLNKRLGEYLEDPCRRGYQTRFGGKENPDVHLEGWHIECCVGQLVPWRAKLKQAMRDCHFDPPVVIGKRDRQQVLTFMLAGDYDRFFGDISGVVRPLVGYKRIPWERITREHISMYPDGVVVGEEPNAPKCAMFAYDTWVDMLHELFSHGARQ